MKAWDYFREGNIPRMTGINRLKKILNILFIFTVLSSCTKKENYTIIGDWEFDKVVDLNPKKDDKNHPPPPPSWLSPEEFEFLENGMCNYKNGLFNYSRTREFAIYSGNILKYQLKNDSLILKYPADSIFNKYRLKITKDSLIFIDTKNKKLCFYNRIKLNPKPIKFDKIIVSSSGCYGSCRISSTIIDKNGNVEFRNHKYTEKDGAYTSLISPEHYRKFEANFNKVDIDTLKNKYSIGITDGNTVSVTFIKDGKIYKTIDDYRCQSPKSFVQAYTPLVYLSQSCKLTESKPKNELDLLLLFQFEGKQKHHFLTNSDAAYLISEILKSKKTTAAFEPLYNVSSMYFKSDDEVYISSNGRFFKFAMKNGSPVTYDLGYNFIEKNNLKFEKSYKK